MSDPAYSASEMMIAVAARMLTGARTVFVGVGLPNIACNLARVTVAPDMELIYESGVYGARPERLPLSIGDPTLVSGAVSVVSMADLFGLYLQRGLVEIALLGGAQIDKHGNLNSTVIGDYAKPKTRLPGSGGACEIATNAQRTFMIMRLKRRAFVEKLDFVTSPGHLTGGDSRSRLGLARRRTRDRDYRHGDLELRQCRARDATERALSRHKRKECAGRSRLATAAGR